VTSEANRTIRIGVLGCGNVGAPLVQLIEQQAPAIAARTGMRLEVATVAVRNLSKDRGVTLPDGVLTRDAHAVVADPSIDLVVEVIGGIEPARELHHDRARQCRQAGRHRQQGTARERRAPSCSQAADGAGVDLLFEAAVAGGIPSSARCARACAASASAG
jgi:homoserine dehydrogenase